MVPNPELNTALARAQIDERRHDADQERAARRARRARPATGATTGTAGHTGWLRHLAHAIMGAAP
jgi:hypothetical protein